MRASTILRKLPFFLMLVVPLILAGCEGDPGPAGPQGPEGPSGATRIDSEYTYVGTAGHALQPLPLPPWSTTCCTPSTPRLRRPRDARTATIPTACSATPRAGILRSPTVRPRSPPTVPDVNGFDDYWGVDTEHGRRAPRRARGRPVRVLPRPHGPDLQRPRAADPDHGHGRRPELPGGHRLAVLPVPQHAVRRGRVPGLRPRHRARRTTSRRSGTSSVPRAAAPATPPRASSSSTDPDYATWTPTEYNFIGCVTCHDPHQGEEGGGNEAQLRKLTARAGRLQPPYDPGDAIARIDGRLRPGQALRAVPPRRRDNANVAGPDQQRHQPLRPAREPADGHLHRRGCYEIPGKEYDRDALAPEHRDGVRAVPHAPRGRAARRAAGALVPQLRAGSGQLRRLPSEA